MDRENVDTDQIIPKQFLKRIERSGYGHFLFYDWRFDEGGNQVQSFILNQEAYRGATILVAGRNFGCGSSREHAVWALLDYGFRVVIAPSFADIFLSNCLKNGLLPVSLSAEAVQQLLQRARESMNLQLRVCLESQVVSDREAAFSVQFSFDPVWRSRLLEGLDEIALTLRHVDKIAEYEQRQI